MIVPKSQSKADFCGVDEYYYIIRPDLNCYMRSRDFHSGEDLLIYSLHPSCRNGDHYLAYEDDHFYIIKSDHYRRVTNLNSDGSAIVYTLHPNCRGGSHYCSAFGAFYIIFQDRGVYRRTTNLHEDGEGKEYTLHPKCKNGLYYFGLKNGYYFVNQEDQWGGITYTTCTNFHEYDNATTYSIHPSIYSFLPGGLAIDKGPSFGEWVCIKTIGNDSQTPIQWQKRVTQKVGYEKEKMSSIEHNWKVSTNVSTEAGGLAALITKAQFSLSVEYGGSSTNTEKENWNQVTEVEETITLTVQPQQKVYIYIYQMGLGKEPVLYCRDMRILDDDDKPNPPTDNPLPHA